MDPRVGDLGPDAALLRNGQVAREAAAALDAGAADDEIIAAGPGREGQNECGQNDGSARFSYHAQGHWGTSCAGDFAAILMARPANIHNGWIAWGAWGNLDAIRAGAGNHPHPP